MFIKDLDKKVSELNSDLDKELTDKLGENYKALVKDIYFRYKISKEFKHEFEEKQTIKVDVSKLDLKENSKLLVYRIHDGKFEALDYTLKDNIVTFESDKFSPYIFATETDSNTRGHDSKDANNKVSDSKDSNMKVTPKTGDSGVVMFGSITLLAIVMLLILIKRKNKYVK